MPCFIENKDKVSYIISKLFIYGYDKQSKGVSILFKQLPFTLKLAIS
jgi:hypothetical protein